MLPPLCRTATAALAILGPPIRRVVLLLLLVLVSPALASAVSVNILAGYGWVGPAQYDQGLAKPMLTVNVTNFFRVSDKFSLGGIGVGIRATTGPDRIFEKGSFDEFGLVIPFFTYRWGRVAGQIGVEIQRANLQKNFYYVAVGLGLDGRRARKQPSGSKAAPASK